MFAEPHRSLQAERLLHGPTQVLKVVYRARSRHRSAIGWFVEAREKAKRLPFFAAQNVVHGPVATDIVLQQNVGSWG
jgi:hypothetical protein